MEPWCLEVGFISSFHPFPEVGIRLIPSCCVYYSGTKVSPPNCRIIFMWSKENKNFVGTAFPVTQVQQQQPRIWIVLGSSPSYVPTKDDVGCCLRLLCYAVNSHGVQMSLTFTFDTSPVRPSTINPCSPRSLILTISGLKRLAKPHLALDLLINRLNNGKRDLAKSRLVKNNIAVVAIFEEISNCHLRICVANTHLTSGMGVSDVRLFQVISLIGGLEKIDSLGIPVLVCGDMNSPPGSDTHTFLVNGKEYQVDMNMRHLDYILYPQDKLKLDGVFKIPFYESIGKKRLLPIPQWSSDHMALVANLRIKKAYRGENFSELPVDPWEELKMMKNIEVPRR
ncbi:OLC1v1012870C1 [Oldenlandia corymbosa var. corymbosa]|uniref:OLC1v1012870C1 n=1 Tax=Oldenlandia corymbosa var. corymbosa TaxID=529605 RepID=A0AAV1DX73_OLDCO|nr:OLC1v1012870C1 [Oldenlandia corymbosa var. corymbosa]